MDWSRDFEEARKQRQYMISIYIYKAGANPMTHFLKFFIVPKPSIFCDVKRGVTTTSTRAGANPITYMF